MKWIVRAGPLWGTCAVPGDKSIGHRSLMLAGLAPGESTVENLPRGQDVLSTAACMRALGVTVETQGATTQVAARDGLRPPTSPLDAGNSGTTMRLLAGILAGQPFHTRLMGDASLSRRPMNRVVEPLRQMGAQIETSDGRAPLDISGGSLQGMKYLLPVASAQVKSAVLLAGLFAEGETSISEPTPTRDHTERMLSAMGVPVERQNGTVTVQGGVLPRPGHLVVPGDFSSAAFFLTAAALAGSRVTVRDAGLNPSRAALLDVLREMGARVTIENERDIGGEPLGEITVEGPTHLPIEIGGERVPVLIDELPLVALLATQAEGTTIVRDAGELRVKETDRIRTVVQGLQAMGAAIEERQDGWMVRGPAKLRGTTVSSAGDHRIAMMMAVAGTIAEGETIVEDAGAASVSFPEFAGTMRSLSGSIDEG